MTALILVITLGLAISFMCSILEAVLLSMTHSYVALLQERGERSGDLLARMRANIDEPIAAILTLNTIAHTVSASVGGALALRVFGDAWIALFSALLTLAILVLSEILPKTIGATFWKQLGPPAAYVLRVLIILLKPVLIPLAWFNRLITPSGEKGPTVSRAEIEILAEIGRREGTLDEEEWKVVTNVMNLSEVRVDEVMTPRTRVIALDIEDGLDGALELFTRHGHRRYPVYEESIDDIVGIITVSDLLRARQEPDAELRSILRHPRFVPESKPVEDLIREMRRDRISMAVVIDEYGGTAGIVTLEDLFEEIIGDIRDEHDPDFEAMRRAPDGSWRLSGGTSIYEVNDRLNLELPESDHATIAGYLIERLGRLGKQGDVVETPEARFEIVSTEGRRIEWVRVRVRGEKGPGGPGGPSGP
ncbi:MAG TPA: hemolysin family protein [Longimicrobiales bacterium]|nr:hemolysin family protein [Longimicrobiales bacterium]